MDETADKYANKTAFADAKHSLTFGEVKENASKIASCLLRHGICRGPAAIYLDRRAEVLASFMGAAYSGNFYTPMDTAMRKTA